MVVTRPALDLRLPRVGGRQVALGRRGVAVGLGDLRRAHQAGDLAGDRGRRVAGLVLPALLRRPRRAWPSWLEGDQEVRGALDVRPRRGVACGRAGRPARSGPRPRRAAGRSRTACRRTVEFCGNEPSGFCCTSNRKSSARLAPAVSPSAISAVAIWYRSRDQTRWYGPDGRRRAPAPRHRRRGDVRAAVRLVLAGGQHHRRDVVQAPLLVAAQRRRAGPSGRRGSRASRRRSRPASPRTGARSDARAAASAAPASPPKPSASVARPSSASRSRRRSARRCRAGARCTASPSGRRRGRVQPSLVPR